MPGGKPQTPKGMFWTASGKACARKGDLAGGGVGLFCT